MAININRYIAKYDYKIAKLICPTQMVDVNRLIEQDFQKRAINEILALCSQKLYDGSKIFQSLWSSDGVEFTDLNDVPDGCQLLIASEQPMSQGTAPGSRLAGIEVVKDWQSYFKLSTHQIQDRLNRSKTRWCDANFKQWVSQNKTKLDPQTFLNEVKVQKDGPLNKQFINKAARLRITEQ